jgi:hypothetical protein
MSSDRLSGMTKTAVDFEALGRQAYINDEHGAPALNAAVQAAIADLPVGGGAAEIMRAFSHGYEAERQAELTRLGF